MPMAGQPQFAVDEDPVQKDVGGNGSQRPIHGNAHLFRRPQQGGHGHGIHLQRIGKAHDAQVFHGDLANGRLVGVDAHDGFRQQHRRAGEQKRHDAHAHQGDAVGTVYPVVVLRSPVLGEKQHAAAHEPPISGEHQRGELRTQAHRRHAALAQRGQHHGVYHASGGGQQILQGHRHGNDRHGFEKLDPGKRLGILHVHLFSEVIAQKVYCLYCIILCPGTQLFFGETGNIPAPAAKND